MKWIWATLKKLGKDSRFVHGMRVTDAETMEVVEMVLCGKLNKGLVQLIVEQGGKALGLSGKDGGLISARKMELEPASDDEDLGFVGEVADVNADILKTLDLSMYIPVVAPVGVDSKGQTYNINADLVAGSLAVSLEADKLILLTDVPGVLDSSEELISSIPLSGLDKLFSRGAISGGMIPKVNCCSNAVRGGVRKAHVIDGRVEHSLLLEIFTDSGIGTEIYLDSE